MESKLKTQAMDSVGELPAGYLHLPTTPIKQEPQLTDWISGDLKPSCDGVYQRMYSYIGIMFCKFQNSKWSAPYGNIELANRANVMSSYDDLPWRGLSSNPNEVQS